MTTEQSFGIIPVRIVEAKAEYLLIEHLAGHWGFPKGHADVGETPLQTATREFKEETGLDICLILREKPFREAYQVKRSSGNVNKQVELFLAFPAEDSIHIPSNEISNYCWKIYDEAIQQLTFPESQKALREAHDFLLEKYPLLKKVRDYPTPGC